MGEVWSARDLTTGRDVAVKVMLSVERHEVDRFEREVRLLSQLQNHHVTQVVGTARLADGRRLMAMELLEGRTLGEALGEGCLSVHSAVRLILQAMEGLAEAHALGIVHRDIKPSNLFVCGPIDEATVKLLDFGISKGPRSLHGEASTLTTTGETLGSPGYLSPEQLRDTKRVDTRSDIWALGLCLHRCVAGRPAFEADNVGEYFAMIMTESPTPLRHHRPDVPAELERIILRCAERDPARRYPDLAALAEALLQFAPGERARCERIRGSLGAAADTTDHFVSQLDDETQPATAAKSLPRAPSRTGRTRAMLAALGALAGSLVACWVLLSFSTSRARTMLSLASLTAPDPRAEQLVTVANPREEPLASAVVAPQPLPSTSSRSVVLLPRSAPSQGSSKPAPALPTSGLKGPIEVDL